MGHPDRARYVGAARLLDRRASRIDALGVAGDRANERLEAFGRLTAGRRFGAAIAGLTRTRWRRRDDECGDEAGKQTLESHATEV
jgi:hypothetical protein